MEKEEAESEKYKELIERMNDAVFLYDLHGNILTVNKKASSRLGYSKEELFTMSIEDIHTPEYSEEIMRTIQEIEEDDHLLFESVHITKDREEIPVESSLSRITYRGEPVILSVVRDISKRKRTEETMWNVIAPMISQIGSDEVFQQIVDNARGVSNSKFVILSLYNRKKGTIRVKSISGVGSSLIKRVSDLLGVGDLFELEFQVEGKLGFENFSQQIENQPVFFEGFHEYSFGVFGERTCKLVEKIIGVEDIIGVPLFNSDNELVGFLAYFFPKEKGDRNYTSLMTFGELASQAIEKSRKIGQLVETREKLKKSKEKYRILDEQSHDGVYIYYQNKLESVNEKACEITGYSEEELYEMNVWDLLHIEDRGRVKRIRKKRLNEDKEAPNTYEARILTKENEVKHLEFAVTQIKYKGKTATLGAARDITKRKEAEKRFQHLFQNLGDAVCVVSLGEEHYGEILEVNETAVEQTGWSKEELRGMDTHDWLVEEPQEMSTEEVGQRLENGETLSLTTKRRRKDGSTYWVEETVVPINYKGRKAVLTVYRDVTDRIKAERKREKARQKLEALHTWAQRLNQADTMNDIFNHTFEAMEETLGFKQATIEMKKDDHLQTVKARSFEAISPKQLPLDGKNIVVKTARTGKTQIVEDVRTFPEYQPRFPQTQSELATPIISQREGKVLGVLNVESEEKRSFNQQDQRLLETLASHVAVAIKELREKQRRVSLQRLDELRNQFLAMASHEINTPLTPIKTNIEMLQKEYFGDLTEEQQQHITQTLSSVNRLVRLVNDFRRTSKLQTVHLTLEKEKQQFAHTIEKALKQYKHAFTEEEITLIKQIEQPLTAVYDEDRMIQVLCNLIENAFDYTDDKIWVHGRDHDDQIYVSVRDNGLGIPASEQAKIFKPFYRVEDEARSREDRRFGGSGLGLHICKRIVEAHDGEIQVDSSPGEGSTFTVILPRYAKNEKVEKRNGHAD